MTPAFQFEPGPLMRCFTPSITTLMWSGADPSRFRYVTWNVITVAVVPERGVTVGLSSFVGPVRAAAGATPASTTRSAAQNATTRVATARRLQARCSINTRSRASSRAEGPVLGPPWRTDRAARNGTGVPPRLAFRRARSALPRGFGAVAHRPEGSGPVASGWVDGPHGSMALARCGHSAPRGRTRG